MMLYRALIKTHHMTSRKKITAITKAAKQYNCAVYLKTGRHPPGVMLGECDGEEGEEDLKAGVRSVKVRIFLLSVFSPLCCSMGTYVPVSSQRILCIWSFTELNVFYMISA